MDLTLARRVMYLSNDKTEIIYTPKALSWTPDNKIVICCAEKLLIVQLVPNMNYRAKQQVFVTTVDEIPVVPMSDSYFFQSGMLNLDCVKQIPEDERQTLITDPALIEVHLFPQALPNTLKHAVCSPFYTLALTSPSYLIATVSFDHFLSIYARTFQGWTKVLDCAPLIKEYVTAGLSLPLFIGEDISFEHYRTLMHSMCTTELCWSQPFKDDHGRPFFLLFTGCRSGHLYVWQLSTPDLYTGAVDMPIQCTDVYSSEIIALAWQEAGAQKGLLAVGYVDGSTRILEVSVEPTKTGAVTLTEIFSSDLCEGLAVSDLTWTTAPDGYSVLIICKQYFLSLYTVHGETVALIGHYHVDYITNALSGVSITGSKGVAYSADSLLRIECLYDESGGVSLSFSPVDLGSLPATSAEVPWICLGAVMSPSAALCFSFHKTCHELMEGHGGRHRYPQMLLVSAPHPLSVEKTISSRDENPENSSHSIITRLALICQHISQSGAKLDSMVDVATLFMNRGDKKTLLIARNLFQFIKGWSTYWKSACLNIDPEWMGVTVDSISERLLEIHLMNCLEKIGSSPNQLELEMLGAARRWVQREGCDVPQLTEQLQKISGAEDLALPLCAVCGSQLSITGMLEAKCPRGHRASLCCLSLLPCQDPTVRKCRTCGAFALSLATFAESSTLNKIHRCPLCSGFLRQSII